MEERKVFPIGNINPDSFAVITYNPNDSIKSLSILQMEKNNEGPRQIDLKIFEIKGLKKILDSLDLTK